MYISDAKRVFLCFLVFVLTIVTVSSTLMASAQGNGKPAVIRPGTASADAPVHRSADARSKVVGTLYKGSTVSILGESGGFYEIVFGKGTGWVAGAYLTDLRPETVTSSSRTSSASGVSQTSGVSSLASSSGTAAFSSSAVSQPVSSSATSAPASAAPAASSSPASSSQSGTSSDSSAPAGSSAASSAPVSPPVPSPNLPTRLVAGYYTAWSAYGGFTPDKIKASAVNVVHYAFAQVGSDLKIAVGDSSIDYTNFSKLSALKRSYPGLKTLISVGGWDASSRFSDMSLNDPTRRAFAQSCVVFIKQYGFDGVDIDWEYPVSGGSPGRAADKQNFTLLMQALRDALNTQASADGRYYYLTFAGGASNSYINNVELPKLSSIVDYAVDMTYDLHGPWDSYTDLNAPLFTSGEASPQYKISVDSSLRAWRNAGFPASRLVMGVPFYGYVYTGVSSLNNGLYQTFSSAKSIGYDSVVSGYLGNGLYASFRHPTALVPYLFGNGTFLSYDDASSIAQKAQVVSANGLRGAGIWELSYDKTYTLLNSLSANIL